MSVTSPQAVQHHPLRNNLNALQTPKVLTELKPADSDPTNDDEQTGSTKSDPPKEPDPNEVATKTKLAKQMMGFLNQLPLDGKESQRSSSFFFGELPSTVTGTDPIGQLIQLKTLGSSKDISSHKSGNDNDLKDGSADTANNITRRIREGHFWLHRPTLRPPNAGVLNPSCGVRQAWDLVLVLLAVMYTALRVPYAIAFDLDEFTSDAFGWFVVNRIVDVIFIMDIYVIFITAQFKGKKLVLKHRPIAMQYLKTWFVLDFVASIPV